MNDYDIFVNYLFSKADKTSTPLSGTFELTGRCTLDCKMCYIHCKNDDYQALKREKSAEWWIEKAREAKNAGTLLLLLTGGEPLVRSDFERIYLECLNLGFMISINTNGTLINKEKVEFFKKNPPQRVNITLYGADGETYEKLCGDYNAYEKVLYAVENLTDAGIAVTLNFTLTEFNKNDMVKVQEYAKKLGLQFRVNSYTFPAVRTSECQKNSIARLSAYEAAKYHFLYMLNNLGESGMKKAVEKYMSGTGGYLLNPCSDMPSGRLNCRAGLSSYWITYDGFMTGCGMMTEPKISAENFNEAWKFINKKCAGIKISGECLNCPKRKICDFCAASAYAETGSFSGKPSYACKKARNYIEACRHYYKADKKNNIYD